MKKILIIVLIGCLVLGGLRAAGVSKPLQNYPIEKIQEFSFSPPLLQETDQYSTIQVQETIHALAKPGKPEMPMVPYALDLPFGVKNIEISIMTSKVYELEVNKKVKPTPPVVSADLQQNINSGELIEDTALYSSEDRYPARWYDTMITSGLKSNNNRVTHISLYLYPVQYSPARNILYYITSATIKISYELPDYRFSFEDEYDLVIIAPSTFSDSLQSLITHKNSNNVKTLLKTTEEIFNEYTGADKPEQIKYFIRDAIETYNISYVLLVGGLKSQFVAKDRDDCNQGSKAWHVPVRYTNVEKTGLHDPGALCDLYYADIYDGEGNFSSWDTDGDGIYAKWSNSPGKDDLDLNPDVYVGRLPCRNTFEVNTVVKKIIDYETTFPSSDSWFKRMVGISGLSHNFYNDQPDGEYLTDLGMSYVENLIDEEVRVYASNEESGGPIPITKDITRAFSTGARFIFFSGHGHPIRWSTHPVDNMSKWMEGLTSIKMWRLFNNKKLPIVVVGGCHDAQFNITWLNTLRAGKEEYQWYWTHGEPGVHCFCWKMVIVPWGGAIASVGGTGLTTSITNNPNTGNSKLATDFFYAIGQDGATTFGEAFSDTIQKFIDENTIGLWETHVLTIWNALGDPSLKLS